MFAADYRHMAWQKLSGKWGIAVLAYLLLSVIMGVLSGTVIGMILLAGPLSLGYIMLIKAIRDSYTPSIEMLFRGFTMNFVNSMLAYILTGVFTFLWSLLFIVPGIIKSYSYAMTFYVMDDHPEMTAMEAIAESQRIMNGNKWRLFCLEFSFIGWYLLCVLTLGVLTFWVAPYREVAKAEFYESIKDN